MDLSNYKSNSYYDALISQLIANQLNYDQAIKQLLNNELIEQRDSQSNEYFLNYFINSLHLSCYWIIYNNNQERSVCNSPIKLMPIKKQTPNAKLDVKRNLFDTPKASVDQANFETKFESRQSKNLNLNDDESFPKLNNSTFIKSTPSSDRKLTPNHQHEQPKSSKKQRRINPTLIKDTGFENNVNFIEIKDKKNLRKTLFEKNRKIFDEAPELEQKDCTRDDIKMMTKDISSISLLTPKKKETNLQLLVRTPSKAVAQEPVIKANLAKVNVDKDKFSNLIEFYTKLIKCNLTPNMLGELDFLIQLVTRRSCNEQSTEFLNPFEFCSNYHNCIYFAVKCLELLCSDTLISYFDEQFFKALSQNEAIKKLSPNFQNQLVNCCDQLATNDDQMHDLSTAAILPSFDFIAYQPETDSNENFLNDNSFHLFRRQRDAFFKLYYEWKQLNTKKYFKQDSILNDQEFKFANKVTFIFSLSKDFANYFHFARLFLAQLMQCCTTNTSVEQAIAELIKSKATPNQSTPNVCENKMKKLNKRFNQQDQKVMATQSSFTGEEIFFYEFIIACNNYSFLTILQSLLISKITELNDPNLLLEAIELDENNLEIASYFCTNLLNLQLLAKFLGLIVFMPFYSKLINSTTTTNAIKSSKNLNNLSEIVKNLHSEETSLCKMINEMILDSIKRKHLISTLPWVIQFLNQMDSTTSALTNYNQTFNLLVDIYHELGLKVSAEVRINKMNYAYLKLIFGNFFEKYFLVCHIKLFELTSSTELLSSRSNGQLTDKTLDSFQLINKKFLNACFPKLFLLKEMVKQQAGTQVQNNVEIRKIKPLSLNSVLSESLTTSTPAKVDKKNLVQIEYEENFFRLHADSLRKTVEFIADRLHSKCIKCLRYDVIKKVKRETFAKYSDLSKTLSILEEIKLECVRFVKEFAQLKISESIDLLISEHDYNQNTINIAKSIALRMLLDKCLNWMTNNTNDCWIINETLVENSRRLQSSDKQLIAGNLELKLSANRQKVPNISYCFNHVRDVICDLLFKGELTCTKEELNYLIDELIRLRNLKSNLNSRANQVMETTMLDLIISLAAFQPKQIDSDLIQKFTSFYLANKITVVRLISARNFYILSLSKESYATWNQYESVLLRFVQKELYSIHSLETDLLCVLGNQNEWDEVMLRKLASCIKSAVDICKSNEKYKDYAEKIELIDWLSWFCGTQDSEIM